MVVDYFPLPGKAMQYVAYNDAVKRFKFQCRYMAFIDGDEFVYPKVDGGGDITTVVDEILSHNPNAGGLAIHWQMFGSNGQEKADYSRGVLERFTRRAPTANKYVKNIVEPRKINFFYDPHTMTYFEGFHGIDETSHPVRNSTPLPIVAEKIVINHYQLKSQEEYLAKIQRGDAYFINSPRNIKQFDLNKDNEEFDDGILRYRAERAKNFRPPDKSHTFQRLFNALAKNLSPTLLPTTPPQFYAGKMETFLTCRAAAAYLKTKLTDDTPAKFFEEASLKAIIKSFNGMSFADSRLLIRELPNLLGLPYPAVKDLRGAALNIIPQMMNIMHLNGMWKDYVELDYLQNLLKLKEV